MTGLERSTAAAVAPSKARRWPRRLRTAGLVLLGLVLLAFAGGWWWLRRSLPQLEGTVEVPGLQAAVRITRDAHGVPTIEAASEEDLFFGLGYVHAQDRFFQMELQRHTSQGRLSELSGSNQIETDKFLRAIGVQRLAIDDEARVLPSTRAVLSHYSQGINAWLEAHRGALPPEMDLLRLNGARMEPEPWRPADSLAWVKMMSFSLSYNYEDELLRSDVLDKMGPALESTLFPDYPPHAPLIVGGEEPEPPAATPRAPELLGGEPDHVQGARESDPALEKTAAIFRSLGYFGRGVGSNTWVIGPGRSTSGHAMLANDPHLGIQSPNIFYVAHLKAPGWDTVGVTMPGIPAVVLGRNARIAWGASNLGADTQDLYVEKADPANPSQYLFKGASLPFQTHVERISVNGRKDPVEVTVRSTIHGPIIQEDWKGKGPLALRWPSLDPGDQTLDAFLGMNRATNWTEFCQAVALMVGPTQNFVYADVDGHIGYTASGKVPVRSRGEGLVPQEGWDGAAEWKGFVPYDELPQVFDPPEGFIVTANNKVAGAGTPFLSTDWDHYRAQRIREIILARPKHSFEDLREMHADVLSTFARDLVPILLTTPAQTPEEKEALAGLGKWDFRETPSSADGVLFTVWYTHLMPALFRDEVGEKIWRFWGVHRPDLLLSTLRGPSGKLCEDVTTPAHESCGDILLRTLRESLAELREKLGPDMKTWRLDKLRVARFENPVGSSVPLLDKLFTRARPVGGDPYTVRVSSFWLTSPYDVRLFQSYIGEFELPGPSLGIIALGQSGHPLSPHFDDLLPNWMDGRALPLGDASGPGSRELNLVPGKAVARATPAGAE